MLAYVFWHWRSPDIEKSAYQQHLIHFHEVLQTHKPDGFQRSATFQIEGAPWTTGEREAYADWYLVDNSAALDVLNAAAVSGVRQAPHDQVAHRTAKGAGGLYSLHSGSADLTAMRFALWFAKPAGMSYDTFYALPEIQQAPGSLWRRHMVLGPTPEFCLRCATDYTLPEGFDCLKLPLTRIWPAS